MSRINKIMKAKYPSPLFGFVTACFWIGISILIEEIVYDRTGLYAVEAFWIGLFIGLWLWYTVVRTYLERPCRKLIGQFLNNFHREYSLVERGIVLVFKRTGNPLQVLRRHALTVHLSPVEVHSVDAPPGYSESDGDQVVLSTPRSPPASSSGGASSPPAPAPSSSSLPPSSSEIMSNDELPPSYDLVLVRRATDLDLDPVAVQAAARSLSRGPSIVAMNANPPALVSVSPPQASPAPSAAAPSAQESSDSTGAGAASSEPPATPAAPASLSPTSTSTETTPAPPAAPSQVMPSGQRRGSRRSRGSRNSSKGRRRRSQPEGSVFPDGAELVIRPPDPSAASEPATPAPPATPTGTNPVAPATPVASSSPTTPAVAESSTSAAPVETLGAPATPAAPSTPTAAPIEPAAGGTVPAPAPEAS